MRVESSALIVGNSGKRSAFGLRTALGRQVFVLIHRYIGLLMTGFLLVAGITGSLLAWNDELEVAISPVLFRVVPPSKDSQLLDPLVLREHLKARYPDAMLAFAKLDGERDRSVTFFLEARPDPVTGKTGELSNNQVFVNPYTGEVLGERRWGDITQGMKNLMSFIYSLHYSLALGMIGSYTFGIVGLLWSVDCFIGAYLTFPARTRNVPIKILRQDGKSWRSRWWSAWKVRWYGGGYKVNFDLHRAGGLWMWAMLFVIAWSSVSFNLSEVYNPVMRTLFAHQPAEYILPKLTQPQPEPGLGWFAARELARKLMAEQAKAQGFSVQREDMLFYDFERALFLYVVRSDHDISDHNGSTRLTLDANTGAFKGLWLPTGVASGDTIREWITSLHMAALWGVPFKIFICGIGLMVVVLSMTGLIIWMRKCAARRKSSTQKKSNRVVHLHTITRDFE